MTPYDNDAQTVHHVLLSFWPCWICLLSSSSVRMHSPSTLTKFLSSTHCMPLKVLYTCQVRRVFLHSLQMDLLLSLGEDSGGSNLNFLESKDMMGSNSEKPWSEKTVHIDFNKRGTQACLKPGTGYLLVSPNNPKCHSTYSNPTHAATLNGSVYIVKYQY